MPLYQEPHYDPAFDGLSKVDPLSRGIFMGLMAYTSMEVKKLAGDQKYYINDRLEMAEGFGDFIKIGTECLTSDKEDIDVELLLINSEEGGETQEYAIKMLQEECFELCLVSDGCAGVLLHTAQELQDSNSFMNYYCGIIDETVT